MFSVITNIYNEKTKRPTSMELFTATGILTSLFHNYSCSVCAPLVTRHTSIRYSSSCHTHASTWVHRYSSLLQWSVPLGQRGHVAMVGRILCTKCTLHSNHRLTVSYSDTQNDFYPEAAIFSLHTLLSPSGRNVNYNEKHLTGGGMSWSFYLYRFRKYVSYGFPIIHFCIHVAHYETLCILNILNIYCYKRFRYYCRGSLTPDTFRNFEHRTCILFSITLVHGM